MGYKTILVCLNEVERNSALMALASDLARKDDAHLIGLYVIPAVQIYPALDSGIATLVIDEYRRAFEERGENVRKQFQDSVRKETVSSEWRLVDSNSPEISQTVTEHGLQSDLVVVSQVDPARDSGIAIDLPERVVMECGRPVLIVPVSGDFPQCGRRILVGWNGTRESARAAFDALPLLKRAEAVHLTWVDPQKSLEPGSLPGAELATALSRHGVKATAEGLPTSGVEPGEALLSHVVDIGADLLVMGAYGHSRMREYVFGGATRWVLQNMNVPVLMSH